MLLSLLHRALSQGFAAGLTRGAQLSRAAGVEGEATRHGGEQQGDSCCREAPAPKVPFLAEHRTLV